MSEIKQIFNDFNTYPHYVIATAFLVNGKLADYRICDREREWGTRTFRGSVWENEVAKHFQDWNLTCEYNKILVHNDKEHECAFNKLEEWLFDTFLIYEKANPTKWNRM